MKASRREEMKMMSPKNKKGSKTAGVTIKRIVAYMAGKYTKSTIAVIISVIVSSVAGVIGNMFIQQLIDDYIMPMLETQNPMFGPLARALGVMAVVYLVGVITTFIYNWLVVAIGQGVQRDIRDEMFSKMQRLPIKYFDTHSYGDVMSTYTNDVDTLRQMISVSIPELLATLVSVVFSFVALLYFDWVLTIVVVVMLFVVIFVTKKVAGASSKYFIAQQKSLGKVNGYIEEMMDGQKVVKIFNYEQEAKNNFDEVNNELREVSKIANTYSNMLMPIVANLGNISYVVVAIVGGIIAINGITSITLGTLVSYLVLTRAFFMPIGQVSQQLNSIIMAIAGAERVFDLMDQQPEQDSGYVTLVNAKYDQNGEIVETKERTNIWAWKHPHHDGTTTYAKLEGDVVLDHVDFSYDGKKMVLNDISLYAKPGQKIAFVGATGAGKTTITNLINRFYDIDDGKIRYDGININKIKKDDLRRSLGVVLQDVNLFTGTVMENIRYGRLDATDEEVVAAAQLAGADSFISRLPDGYDTVLKGDGSGLSQGQRQLISIARAAVADPPVMILDEATSSIDTRTEIIVQKGMDALMTGRTVFVIAHRLSTIKNSDVIMVMDNGRIIERGDHDSLIKDRGRYYQLYTGSFGTIDEMEAELKSKTSQEKRVS